jgi:hypothetical protein
LFEPKIIAGITNTMPPVEDVSAGERGGRYTVEVSDPSRVTKYRGADKGLTGV